MPLSSTLRRCRELTLSDWGILCELCLLSLRASLRWHRKSFQSAVNSLMIPVPDAGPGHKPQTAERFSWLAEVFFRRLDPGSTCLKRALVLTQLFRRRGIAATLKIGVRKEGDALEGHAWVVYGERIFLESSAEVERYELVFDLQGIEFA